jgi:photosystem II stability/assembly factor-like uncharacterized protein
MKNLLLVSILLILLLIDGYCQNNSNALNSQQSYEWNVISEVPNGMNKIYFIDSTNGWTVGDSGRIYATDNGGITWLPQNSGTVNKLVSIYFMDDQIGFVSGYNRTLICTNNGGNTWSPVPLVSDSGSIYSSLCSDDNNNLYFISNFGEVYCSNDSGTNWQNMYNFNMYGFSYVDYSNNPVCFAKQLSLGIFYKSTDGGDSWEKFYTPSQWSSDIYFLNGDVGWVAEDWALSSTWHDSLSVYMTLNGGETWIQQSSLQGLSLNNIVFIDKFEGWTSMVNKIYYTTNSSKSWICQFECDNLDWIENIFFLNNRNGWAVTNQGQIIKYGTPVEVFVDKTENTIIHQFVLDQNFPNPFNPITRISYSIPNSDFFTLKVFDILGRELQTLVNEFQMPSNYVVNFDSNNLPGGKASLSSGIYLYKFQVGNDFIETKKMLFLK